MMATRAISLGPQRPTWAGALGERLAGRVCFDEPMSKHTSLGVGGPAQLWYEPSGPKDLVALLNLLREERVAYTVVGGGSNLLVGDLGVKGVVVHLAPSCGEIEERPRGERIELSLPAGLGTTKVRALARERGLCGPEFLIGIPGTLGGALQMNAGTRLGEMVGVVVGAQVAHPDGLHFVSAEDLNFAYRHAHLPSGGIVSSVILSFRKASQAQVQAAQDRASEELAYRKKTQPRGRSAGSIFKNPPGDFAGRLIESAGLKGRRCGDAVVSEDHANFIVNRGHASAREVLDLIDLCRHEVATNFGVQLELEVKLLGAF